jgi:ferredoxin
MSVAIVRFDNEDLEGFVAVDTYLADAAGRFGVKFDDACLPDVGEHFCSFGIAEGAGNLSPLTKLETEYFAKNGRGSNERLACQAKITKAGEVVIMTQKKKEKAAEGAPGEDANEKYRKEFSELPFEQKISNLVQLEAIALGETFAFVVNSPFKIFEKLGDVMAEFGFKKEEEQKRRSRPPASANGTEDSKSSKTDEVEESGKTDKQ